MRVPGPLWKAALVLHAEGDAAAGLPAYPVLEARCSSPRKIPPKGHDFDRCATQRFSFVSGSLSFMPHPPNCGIFALVTFPIILLFRHKPNRPKHGSPEMTQNHCKRLRRKGTVNRKPSIHPCLIRVTSDSWASWLSELYSFNRKPTPQSPRVYIWIFVITSILTIGQQDTGLG